MKSHVPIDVLAFQVLRRATCVWIPRADGNVRAQLECVGKVIGRHGSRVWLLVLFWS